MPSGARIRRHCGTNERRCTMKNNRFTRQLAISAAVLFITLLLFPAAVHAEDRYTYKIKSLHAGSIVTAAGSTAKTYEGNYVWSQTVTVYKISVPSKGYVRVKAAGSSTPYLYLLKSNLNKKVHPSAQTNWMADGSLKGHNLTQWLGLGYASVKKGTYYIYAEKGTRFQYNFKKQSTKPSNTGSSKAIKIKSGTTEYTYINKGYKRIRWFKISVPSNKVLTIILKSFFTGESWTQVKVYDSKLKSVYLQTGTQISKTLALKKGTYYIKLDDSKSKSDALYSITCRTE